VHTGVEMKYRECVCPLSYSVHCNFLREGDRVKDGGRAPPTLSIMMELECTPQIGRCYSVVFGEDRRVDRVNIFSVITFPLFFKTTKAFIFV
jgi:hypothetical protein